MKPKSNEIVIFTDGASRGNPGPGGFGAVIILPEQNEAIHDTRYTIQELGGREERTTNNRMELQAAISALSSIPHSQFPIRVYTDSAYLLNGITRWIHSWQKSGWKTKAKQDVENKDLWEALAEAVRGEQIEWKQVEGHTGVAGNHRADEIATAYADGKSPPLYADVLENYSIKNIRDVSWGLTSHRERGRTSKRQRTRATAHSYVSMVDGKIETHKTWAECEKRVKGKHGAKHKKVFSAEEEHKLIDEWST